MDEMETTAADLRDESIKCLNTKYVYGFSRLGLAMQNNDIEKVKLYLTEEANCGNVSESGPLHFAVTKGNYDMVQMLLDCGCDVNDIDALGRTPLYVAVDNYSDSSSTDEEFDIVKLLISAGSNINEYNKNETPLLCKAIKSLRLVKLLLKFGARVNVVDKLNRTPLNRAIKINPHIAQLLIEAGSDVNHVKMNTYLHEAAENLDIPLMELLLRHGASATAVNKDGLDVLTFCLMSRWKFISNYFEEIESDDDIEIGLDILRCMEILIKHGADVNSRNQIPKRANLTPLYCALNQKNKSIVDTMIVQFLLENGATFDFSEDIVRLSIEKPHPHLKIAYVLIKFSLLFCAEDSSKQLPYNIKYLKENLALYHDQCKAELELLKKTMVYNQVSLLSLLLYKNIGPYARNDELAYAFDRQMRSNQFSIYVELLAKRFYKEREKQTNFREAAEGLNHLLGWQNFAVPSIIDDILSLANQHDLNTLKSI